MRCTLSLFFLFLALPLSLPAASPPQFTVTDIGENIGEKSALGLNDRGQVVGVRGSGNGQAFLWQNGKMTKLGVLPPLGTEDNPSSAAYGINNAGQIVGISGSFGLVFMTGLLSCRSFLYQNGKMTQIDHRDTSFEAYSINGKGQIVGLDGLEAFLYEHGKVIDLGTLSKAPVGNDGTAQSSSTAQSINNAGQIVGWSTAGKGKVLAIHAFLWQRGKRGARMHDLGMLPGGLSSQALSINDHGQIIGFSDIQLIPEMIPQQRACLWQNGRIYTLGALAGYQNSEADSINNAGQVVGWSGGRAFLWQHSKMLDLNGLISKNSGWVLQETRTINNKGQILGSGLLNGQPHTFLLTPHP